MKLSDLKTYKVVGQAPTAPTAAPQGNLLDHIGGAINSVVPGAQLGKAIGTSLYGIGEAIHQSSLDPIRQANTENNANMGRVIGDTANAALTAVSPALGGPAGSGAANLAGRVATNVGLGAAFGGTEALSQGKTTADIGGQAIAGGALGGAGSIAGEGLNAILGKLPNRLVKQALPKLTPGNEEYALHSTKLGSIASNLEASSASVQNLGQQVHTILSHPEYANDVGAGDFAIKKTLNAFPNSDYTPAKVITTVKQLVPAQAKLVDKVANGTATLMDKNQLRQAIDPVIKKVFTDHPEVTATKQIGAEFANALRGEVQSYAPETQPLFKNLSKEIDLRNALQSMRKKLDTKSALGLYDIVAALSGFTLGGPVGTASAIAAEKAFRSPGVGLAAAKGIDTALPIGNAIAKGLKAPAINAASNLAAPSSPVQSMPQPTGQVTSPNPAPISTNVQASNPLSTAVGALKSAREAVFPTPKNDAEAQKMGLIPFHQRDGKTLYIDPTGGIGSVEKAGTRFAGIALSRIHPEDVQIITKFVNGVRLGHDLPMSIERGAQSLAEHWGINVNKSAQSIADQFENILRGTKKVASTNLGKFTKPQ